jgi:DNA-binding response OmpR family regulator
VTVATTLLAAHQDLGEGRVTDGGAPRVLVVEDEEDLATLVELNLELSGYQVTTASNGRAALDRIGADLPDIVLLDVMMPVIDGWQVLRELKADSRTEDIPVIMLTALSEERDLIRGHLQGAVRYVTKPFEMRALIDTIEQALQPPDDEELASRRHRTRQLLQRLAELDSGRSSNGPRVQFSRLEHPRPTSDGEDAPSGPADPELLDELTEQQRYVAEQLADGIGARQIANDLGVSRSNVYAVRKRIARRLGVEPDDVADVARRLLAP